MNKNTNGTKVDSVIDSKKWTWPDGQIGPTRPDLAPGAWCFKKDMNDNLAAIDFVCPCGCGQLSTIPIKDDWNGDLERPTLIPSILRKSGCGWHGFLTNGIFMEC